MLKIVFAKDFTCVCIITIWFALNLSNSNINAAINKF